MVIKIGVLGCGLGGLYASNQLLTHRSDVEVKILEKTKYPGGRVKTLEFERLKFDVGPTLLAPIFLKNLKRDFGIKIPHININWDIIATERRIPLRIDNSIQAIKDVNFLIQNRIYKLIPALCKLPSMIPKMNSTTVFDFLNNLHLPISLKTYLTASTMVGGLSSDNLEASSLNLIKYAHNFKYPIGGMTEIIKELSNMFFTHGGKMDFECDVKSIEESGEKVRVKYYQKSEEKTEEFDYIISNVGVKKTYELARSGVNFQEKDFSKKIKRIYPTIQSTHFLYAYSGDIKNFKVRTPLINYYPMDSIIEIDSYIESLRKGIPVSPKGFHMIFPSLIDKSIRVGDTYPISFMVISVANPSDEAVNQMQRYIEEEVTKYILTDFATSSKLVKILKPKDFIPYYDDAGTTSPISTKFNYPHFNTQLSKRIMLAGTGAGIKKLGPSVIQASKSGLKAANTLLKLLGKSDLNNTFS